MIVALEGIDAVGKATQAKLLGDRLLARVISFPAYDTPTGQEIKRILGASKQDLCTKCSRTDPTPLVIQALMLTNRWELWDMITDPGPSGRPSAVLDRYWASGYAYGKAEGLDGEWLLKIHSGLPLADVSILLDMDVEAAIERAVLRGRPVDRYERRKDSLERVAANYRELFVSKQSALGGKCHIIDASKSIEEVHKAIMGVL